jgi:hypothetical protein
MKRRALGGGLGTGPRRARAQALALLGLFLAAGSAPSQPVPGWWEIELTVKADGQYRLESGAAGASGTYSLALRWTGGLEKDDHDYLLYAFKNELLAWEAGETATGPETQAVYTTRDFKNRPEFLMKYILREGDELRLNFAVSGFEVPITETENTFALLLPSSEENDQRGPQGAYNPGVTRGSNRVAVREDEIYRGPVTRRYRWSWRGRQWLPRDRSTSSTSQWHDAVVELRITPRFAPPQPRDSLLFRLVL